MKLQSLLTRKKLFCANGIEEQYSPCKIGPTVGKNGTRKFFESASDIRPCSFLQTSTSRYV
jgi:hypothetical protein